MYINFIFVLTIDQINYQNREPNIAIHLYH